MLFGLSYNALGAVAIGAFVYMYGAEYLPGVSRSLGGAGISAAVLAGVSYYLGLGDMLAGMLGM